MLKSNYIPLVDVDAILIHVLIPTLVQIIVVSKKGSVYSANTMRSPGLSFIKVNETHKHITFSINTSLV